MIQQLRRLPLPIVLVVPFMAQILVIVSLVGYLSYAGGKSSILGVLAQMQRDTADRADDLLQEVLRGLQDANQRNANNLRPIVGQQIQQTNTMPQGGQLDRHLWNQVITSDDVDLVGFATATGEFTGVERNSRGKLLIRSTTDNGELCRYLVNHQGDRQAQVDCLSSVPNPDFRQQPWYRMAVGTGEPTWSIIDPPFQKITTYLSVTQPLWGDRGRPSGVLMAGLRLSHLGQRLATMQAGKPGQLLILERSGHLIAASTGEKPAVLPLSGGGRQRLTATSSENPVTAEAARATMRLIQGQEPLQDRQATITVNEEQYAVFLRPFNDASGLDWWLVVVTPHQVYSSPLEQNRWLILGLCGGAMVLAGLTGWGLAHWVTRPLMEVHEAAQALASGQWQRRVTGDDRPDRLGELARAFNFMANCVEGAFIQLTAQNQELRRIDRLKDEFLASTSHALRSPLAGMIAIVESLLRGTGGPLTSLQKTNLELLLTSNQRLQNLVNDLLDVARLRYGDVRLDPQAIDLRSAVQVAITMLQPLADRRHLTLVMQIPDQLPPVMADPDRLQQILLNLLDYAIQQAAGQQILIAAEFLSEQDMVRVSTLDRGPEPEIGSWGQESALAQEGSVLPLIADSPSSLVLEPAQLDSIGGLSVTITKRLVELHGGTLALGDACGHGWGNPLRNQPENAPGNQATTAALATRERISFTIPIAWTREPPTLQIAPSNHWTAPQPLPPTTADPDLLPSHILVVDDDPLILQGLANWLALEPGFRVSVALSGRSALAQIQQGPVPDLLLLDLRMPDLTGYEVIAQLRQTWSPQALPIVLLSERACPQEIVAGLAAGANDHLTKPVTASELIARTRAHLQVRQLQLQQQRAAAEHERKIALFLDALPVGVAVYQAGGDLLYLNSLGRQLLNLDPNLDPSLDPSLNSAAPLSVSLADRLYRAGTDQPIELAQIPVQLGATGQAAVTETIELDRGSRRIPFEMRAVPITDEAGQVTYAVVTFQDITERQKTATILANYSRSLEAEVANRTAALIESNRQLEIQILERQRAEQALQRANQELTRLAQLDGLTQVANRRGFDEHLAREWARLARSGRPLSLLLLDVDCFKAYNDCYGHPSGDDCLIQVARVLADMICRPADLVARYGGEEFAIILPETPLEGAIAIAHQVRTRIRGRQLPHERSIVAPFVTVSIGVSCLVPSSDCKPATLIAMADSALYCAKQAGRDRYCVRANHPSIGQAAV